MVGEVEELGDGVEFFTGGGHFGLAIIWSFQNVQTRSRGFERNGGS